MATNSISKSCNFCTMQTDLDRHGVVYQDEDVFVIPDARPQTEKHFLILPRQHIVSADSLQMQDKDLWMKLLLVTQKVARAQGIDVKNHGYQIKINAGRDDSRKWPHLHFHLLGGKMLIIK